MSATPAPCATGTIAVTDPSRRIPSRHPRSQSLDPRGIERKRCRRCQTRGLGRARCATQMPAVIPKCGLGMDLPTSSTIVQPPVIKHPMINYDYFVPILIVYCNRYLYALRSESGLESSKDPDTVTSTPTFSIPANRLVRGACRDRSEAASSAPVPVQSIGFGPDGDEFRRRQHVRETARARSA